MKMSKKEEFIYWARREWLSMFPGGYIGDGVEVDDIDFEKEYEALTEKEVDAEIKAWRKNPPQVENIYF